MKRSMVVFVLLGALLVMSGIQTARAAGADSGASGSSVGVQAERVNPHDYPMSHPDFVPPAAPATGIAVQAERVNPHDYAMSHPDFVPPAAPVEHKVVQVKPANPTAIP